jgi:hypothetical protein
MLSSGARFRGIKHRVCPDVYDVPRHAPIRIIENHPPLSRLPAVRLADHSTPTEGRILGDIRDLDRITGRVAVSANDGL